MRLVAVLKLLIVVIKLLVAILKLLMLLIVVSQVLVALLLMVLEEVGFVEISKNPTEAFTKGITKSVYHDY